MPGDGSCPECSHPHVDRADFTYAREGDTLTGLTCLATCPKCGAVWAEVYRLEQVICDEPPGGGGRPDSSPAPPPPAPPRPAGPLKRPRR